MIIGVGLPLTSGMKRLDGLLGGLKVGDMVLLEGDVSASRFSHLLSVRAQLPAEEGGLGSTVIWLDGGNNFNPYVIAEFSKGIGLHPEQALKGIYISRAFTCYQMSSLVLEKLWEGVENFGSRLVVISDLPSLYLQSDLPKKEAAKAFEPVIEELRSSPKGKEVLILVTSLEHPLAERDGQIIKTLVSNADIIIRMGERRKGTVFELRKHPSGRAGRVVLGPEVLGIVPLDEFLGGVVDG
jgi:hypothetical protein